MKPNGEKINIANAKNFKEAIVDTKISTIRGVAATSAFTTPRQTAAGIAETLSYRKVGGTWNTNFGIFGQDVMLQFFEATANMDIKAIGFTCSDDAGAANATLSFRIIKLNWTAEKMKSFTADTRLGYYPSTGDGMNNVDPFGEAATGNWVSTIINSPLPPWTNNANPALNTFAYDLWSDGGHGWPVTPVLTPSTAPIYSWISTADLGFEPKVAKGEVFAVVATNDGITLDDDRIGLWSDATLGIPGWKYYENGRSIVGGTGDVGWWVRMYTWDFAVAVEITSDTPPEISNITNLNTTLSTSSRRVEATIIDYNPGGGLAGVASAVLKYAVNGGNELSVSMSKSGNVYSC